MNNAEEILYEIENNELRQILLPYEWPNTSRCDLLKLGPKSQNSQSVLERRVEGFTQWTGLAGTDVEEMVSWLRCGWSRMYHQARRNR